MLDGTDPLNPDSLIERLGSIVCADWNGFLSELFQVVEVRNTISEDIDIRFELLDIFGEQQDVLTFSLAQNQQLRHYRK